MWPRLDPAVGLRAGALHHGAVRERLSRVIEHAWLVVATAWFHGLTWRERDKEREIEMNFYFCSANQSVYQS